MTRQKPNLWISNNQKTTLHCCKQQVNDNLCTAGSNVIFIILDLFFCCRTNQGKFCCRLMRRRCFFSVFCVFCQICFFDKLKSGQKYFRDVILCKACRNLNILKFGVVRYRWCSRWTIFFVWKKKKHHFSANQKTNFPSKDVFWLHERHFMQLKQDFLTAG